MKLLVSADVMFYNIGNGYNVRKEFVIEVNRNDFTNEDDFHLHIRVVLRERISDIHKGEQFGFVILNIINLTELIK